MSANEGAAMKLRGKEGYVDTMKVRLATLETTTSVTDVKPRFRSHTQSSLLKRKEPIRPQRRGSSTGIGGGVLQKPGKNVVPPSRLNGINKRSRVTKQSKSMHALKMIIKREKDRQSLDSLRGDPKQTTSHGHRTGTALVFLQHDLINDVSHDFKKHTRSSTELVFFQETPEFVDRFEEEYNTENMHTSRQDDKTKYVSCNTRRCIASSSRNDRNSSKDRNITEISHKLQTNDDKNTCPEVKVLYHGKKRTEPGDRSRSIFSNMDRSIETQIRKEIKSTDTYGTMIHKHVQKQQKIWMNGKTAGRSEEIVDRTNLQGKVKFIKHADCTQGKEVRPFMNSKTVSFQKSYGLQKKDQFSVKRNGSCGSGVVCKNTCSKQAKVVMKENRNPPVDHVKKICKQFTETKQSRGVLPDRGRLLTKTVYNSPKMSYSKISDKRNGTNSIKVTSKSKSKSKSSDLQRKRSITSKNLSTSNSNDHCHVELTAICKKSLEQSDINALKEINGRYDVNISEKNIDAYKSKISVHEANETLCFLRNDSKEDSLGLKKISRPSETVETQTLSHCNKNVTEIGCNTTPYKPFCKDAAISCDLINWTNLTMNLTTIENRSLTEDVPIHEIKFASVEDKNFHENKEFLTSEYKETLDPKTSSKSENDVTKTISELSNYDNITAISSVEIDAIRDFTTEDLTMKKIIHEENALQNKIYSESSKHCNYDRMNNNTDELQDPIKCFKDHQVNTDSINNLSSGSNDKLSLESYPPLRSIYNYDVSCSSSSEEVTEYLENHAQYNEMIVPELKLKNISIYNYDVSCSSSSKEATEYFENNAQYNEMIVPELKLKNISIYNYDVSCSSSSEGATEYLENNAQYNKMLVPELKLKNISNTLIAAFQLAAERGRNLHEAIILYQRNLMTKTFEKQKKAIENNQTSSKDQHCIQNEASFESCDNENKIRSERESGCRFIMKRNEDFDVLSTSSSSSTDSDWIHESKLQISKTHQIDFEVDQAEMNAAVLREKKVTANSILSECINLLLANVKLLCSLVLHRMRKRHEILEVERDSDDERFTPERETSILPVIRDIKTISQQLLFLLVCCIVIILVHSYLHFSFTFHCLP